MLLAAIVVLRIVAFYLLNMFPIMPSTGDEDPSGDAILVVGNDQVRISASSQLLRIASRSSSKMLGSNFKEGQPDDADTREEISLPDDKLSVIDLMFNIIHYRIHETSLAPTVAKLHDDAIVSDKHDCIQATSLKTTAWIQPDVNQHLYNLGMLMVIVFIFIHREAFH
jgi:hypothetical protein